MKPFLVFSCLLVAVSGQKAQKTTLLDIETDYQANQKRTKSPSPPKVQTPAPSPTQFGFVPAKTVANYIQQGPEQTYVQPAYVPQYSQQYPENSYPQYARTQQYTVAAPQNPSSAPQRYTIPPYSPEQKYTSQIPIQYVPQAQAQTQYQPYENVQYVTDNSIGQDPSQYYTPQYVYLQQYQAPSTAVQTVVDPKGGLQYIMYIPTYVPTTAATAQETPNYENVVHTIGEAQDSSASYQVPQAPQTVQYTTQYVPQKEQVQYIQPKSKFTKAEYVIKSEPKSLLDSYVPSILQLQYYNRAQQNSIQEPVKTAQTVSGKEYVKSSYRSVDSSIAGAASVVNRQRPTSYRS